MAKRRMLSIDFCESDRFYMLSPVSRMLYVHFILNADDDGFVDKWRSIMRCARIEKKFYLPLVEFEYVTEINEGLILITHWHRHNTIRADRYVPTAYAKVLRGFSVDEEKRYIKASEDVLVTQCAPQSRIDKIREDKSISDKSIKEKEKKRVFTTNNHSYIHTQSASQNINNGIVDVYCTDKDNQSLCSSTLSAALKTAITLYFMKKYQTIDILGFIEYCESRNWIGDEGESIKENYKKYADIYMETAGK